MRWVAGVLANDWAAVAWVFLVTRAVALLGAYSGAYQAVSAQPGGSVPILEQMTLNWDAAWYRDIALYHYEYDPLSESGSNIAFPPLYPFLISLLAGLLRAASFGWDWGHPAYGPTIAAGLLVSNASLYVALALLVRLLRPRIGRVGALWVALALASLPLAFFFSALYTEGLFLLLVVASFLAARSDWRWKWLCVGLLGMLATLTRFTGVLLLPVLLIEYVSQSGWKWHKWRKVRPDALWLLLIPAGIALYTAFLWWRFGDAGVFAQTQQQGWGHRPSFFLETYWRDLGSRLWHSLLGLVPPSEDWVLIHGNGNRLYAFLDLLAPIALLLGAIIARKKVLASEWAWLVLGVVFPLSLDTTNSLARYMLPLWPGLIWLGTLRRPGRLLLAAWIVVSLCLLAWCASIYASARWIG